MKWPPWLILTTGLVFGIAVGLMLAPWRATGENVKIPLWLEVMHRVLTSVGGLGTFVALIFVVRQFNLLRTQSELVQKNTAAAMDAQLYARLDSFNKFVVEHDKEYDLLDTPLEKQAPEHRSKLHRM
jgi:heme A synthase